jgi:hypothetical protein
MKVSAHIRQAVFERGTVLLDLRRGEFFWLDGVAAAMWQDLSIPGKTEDTAMAELREQFDVQENRLAEDFRAFRERCLREGLLQESDRVEPVASKRRTLRKVRFITLAAWACLARTARQLKRRGFTEAWQDAIEQAPQVTKAADEERLARAEKAFMRAENFFVGWAAPDDCLPRSMALFRFLRSMGLPAEHHIGLDRHSLIGHAWVECGGRTILDTSRSARLTKMSAAAP